MLASQQIIEALKTRLAGNTDAGSRVYSDRAFPLDEAKLPAIRIFELEEQITPQTVHYPVLQQHDLAIAVEHCVKDTAGVDATLAALRLQTLTALFDTAAHATLGIAGLQIQQRGVGPLQPLEGSDIQIAQRTEQLNAQYRTFSNAPEAFA